MTTVDGVDLDFATLEEIHETALAHLDPGVQDFLEGGAGQEVTLRRNRAAFDRWAWVPRIMSGTGTPDISGSFLGMHLDIPVMTAPFGTDGLFDPEGHVAVARANEAAGTVSIVPEAGTFSIERVAGAAPAAAAIGQFHPLGTDETFLAMMHRYEDAGYRALCITCDCPTGGWRERNLRNRFSPDETIIAGNYPGGPEEYGPIFGQLFEQSAPIWTWDRLASLLGQSPLPWIAKGIMTVQDARAALDAGASALLVSNHGGRQLDGQRASLDALPEIREAVGPHVQIALDSGIRRGSDVVKAIALGADAVVIGRLAVYGLAAGGQGGVGRVMDLLGAEIRNILALLGRGSLADVGRDAVMRVSD